MTQLTPTESNTDPFRYFNRAKLLMGREVEYPLGLVLETNLLNLVIQVNKLRELWGKPMIVTSCYRPGKYNTQAKGSATSAHLTCEAMDIADADGKLKQWIAKYPDVLRKCGLYMEDPKRTPTWIHVQTRKPISGSRIFKP